MLNVDTAVARIIHFGERYRLQLRGEFFNLFNHSNYRLVARLINVPATFGRVQSQFDPRQIQLAAKFYVLNVPARLFFLLPFRRQRPFARRLLTA